MFVVSATAMIAAMPLVGRLFDRARTRYVFALGLAVMSASLVGVTLVEGVASAVIYALLFGVTNAFGMTMFGYIWPRYFGRLHLGSIQGTGQMIGVVGASVGPLPVGLAFDLLGDPSWMIRLLAVYPVCAAAVAIRFLRTPEVLPDHAHLE